MKISISINTFDEERNIKNCLESVKWADEIVVVDMYSTDKTVEIAKDYTDKIFYFENVGYADPARQFARDKTSCEWILIVDADEVVPKKLRDRLVEIMEEDLGDVIYIPHNNYFAGKQINTMGWGALDDLHPRFFKREYLNFGDQIHEFFQIDENARIYKINDPEEGFIHFSYINFEHYIEKSLNGYTSIEARNIFEGKKEKVHLGSNFITIWFKLFREFMLHYILAKGYKDGFRGFSISFLSVMYRMVTYMKVRLMEEYDSEDTRKEVIKEYQNIADKVIKEYQE